MKRTVSILAGLALVLCAAPVAVADDEQPGPNGRLQGEVVAVREQVRQHNQGEFTEIQIQTRNQERYWLQLGPKAQYGDAVQVGDQVRVRTMAGPEGEPAMVKAMHNFRSGERIRVRDGSGQMIQTQNRLRDGSGTGIQAREQNRQRQGSGQGGSGGGGSTQQGGGGKGGKGGR